MELSSRTAKKSAVKKEKDGQKKVKEKLGEKFRLHCREVLFREPPTYIINNYIKDKQKAILIDLSLIQSDDLIFMAQLVRMPINKIKIFYPFQKKENPNLQKKFHETVKFKQLLREFGEIIANSDSIKSLCLNNISLAKSHLRILGPSIATSNSIRELEISQCSLTDDHLNEIKQHIGRNQSLAILNLTSNCLKESGGMIGKILSEHSTRRDQIVWMASLRSELSEMDEDPSKKGLCEINLQNNSFDDDSVRQMLSYLKDDQWTRCINLRNNKIEEKGIKEFAMLMKKNLTIISLDLRENPGFNKSYSGYIIKKLRENIERYREIKEKYEIDKNNDKKHPKSSLKKQDKHKSMEQSRHRSTNLRNSIRNLQLNFNNNTLGALAIKPHPNNNSITNESDTCSKCKKKTMQLFQLEKKHLDLHLQLKRVRRVLLEKNIDINISAIEPLHNVQSHNTVFESFQKITGSHPESDEEIVMKVEQIMGELTKIMENIEAQQHTQINIDNNLSNAHSLSNTIPLYSKPDELEQGLEIEENIDNSLTPNILNNNQDS